MGRTTRWLRSLLGGKKESRGAKERDLGEERREKKRWSFKRDSSDTNGANQAPAAPAAQDSAAWLRTVYSESEREQNKHAIAVAAATAAAADAAVAAAQAAVAVVRLTSHGGRGGVGGGGTVAFGAAVKIQTVFRAYLAKKALRALKSLVKLQALVRGYLVRKQAAATLQSMQALVRAQATIRAQKCRSLLSNERRKSHERFEETRSEHLASAHSRRLSATLDTTSNGYDRSPKIVEIDTCRPKSRSSRSRTSTSLLDSGEDTTLNSASSPLQCQIPTRISVLDCNNFQDYYWCHPGGDKCRYSCTAQSTPRYMNPMAMGVAPATPAKSVSAADGAFRRFFMNCPNYMSNTQSFEAKVRSQSAPKQRPEPAVVPGPRKRLPLSEVLLESRASLSGVGMQRSCNRVQEQFDFKRAVVGRIDRSVELARETEQEFYLQRKW